MIYFTDVVYHSANLFTFFVLSEREKGHIVSES